MAHRSESARTPLRGGVAHILRRGRAFEVITRKSTFRSGSGLPGRVWETGAPAYIPDVGHDVVLRRADIAAREMIRAAIAFPILLGCEVIGVIGFISRDIAHPDQELLAVLASIGSQMGEFTKAHRSS